MSTDIEGIRLRINGSAAGLSNSLNQAQSRIGGFLASIGQQMAAFRATAAATEQTTQAMTFGGIAAKLGGIAAAAMTARSAIDLASQAEQTATSLRVLTGSAQKATEMIGQLRNLAASTPLEFASLTENAKVMLNFGLAAETVLPNLRILGDITGGNAEKMRLMTLAFSQSAAAGRLMGQDLLQMVNGGFNPLLEISERTGISMVELKKRMEEGNISFAAVRAAFQSATAEGGRFAGMMDAQSKTYAGAVGKLRDAWQLLLAKIGTQFLPALINLATNLTQLIDILRGVSGESILMAAQVVAAVAAFRMVLAVIPPLVAAYQALSKSQAIATALAGPTGWANLTIGLIAAGAAVYALDAAFTTHNQSIASSTTQLKSRVEAQNELNTAMESTVQKSANMSSAMAQSVQQQAQEIRQKVAQYSEATRAAQELYERENALIEQQRSAKQRVIDDSSAPEFMKSGARKIIDEQAWEARSNLQEKSKAQIASLTASTQQYQKQLEQLGATIATNTEHWKTQANATKEAFKLPFDKLKEQLTALGEQVRQGGLDLKTFEQAASKAVLDFNADSISKQQALTAPTQFAGALAGSQQDIQAAFNFKNQYSNITASDKQTQANDLLARMLSELQKMNLNQNNAGEQI